ncbi:MAG: hypothetical protein WA412_00240 [Candidatus Sulfotelmatobacter sp.]
MWTRNQRNWKTFVLALSLAAFVDSAHAADLKAEDIVAKHLDSIGTREARAAVKSRAVQGKLRFKILVGGTGEVEGSWGRVSEGRKSTFVMRFGLGDWRGEQFVFNGDKTWFAAATASHVPSQFAKFVNGQDFIIKEGLLGGELSTGWALLNLDPERVKLDSIGLKKIDGHELQGIEYHSKGHTDMTIKMYFDPETFRHVMTVYSYAVEPNMSHTITDSVNQQEIRYTIEERFSDFQTDNGITLPHHYDLQYSQELQNGSTRVYDWDMTADRILTNLNLDPGNFAVK